MKTRRYSSKEYQEASERSGVNINTLKNRVSDFGITLAEAEVMGDKRNSVHAFKIQPINKDYYPKFDVLLAQKFHSALLRV